MGVEIETDNDELREDLLCLGLLALFTGDRDLVRTTCELIERYDPEGWAQASRTANALLNGEEEPHGEG